MKTIVNGYGKETAISFLMKQMDCSIIKYDHLLGVGTKFPNGSLNKIVDYSLLPEGISADLRSSQDGSILLLSEHFLPPLSFYSLMKLRKRVTEVLTFSVKDYNLVDSSNIPRYCLNLWVKILI